MRFQSSTSGTSHSAILETKPVSPSLPVYKAVTSQNRLLFLIGTFAKQDFRSCRLSLEGLLALGELPAERRCEPRLAPSGMSKTPAFGTHHDEAETLWLPMQKAPSTRGFLACSESWTTWTECAPATTIPRVTT
jgi:hypothetical protein